MGHLTTTEMWAAVLATASAIVLLSNAVEKIVKAWRVAKAPTKEQDARLDALEEWRKTVDRKLEADKTHLGKLDEGNRVTQQALLALLDHGIDGNNTEQMQHAKEALQQYLIDR